MIDTLEDTPGQFVYLTVFRDVHAEPEIFAESDVADVVTAFV